MRATVVSGLILAVAASAACGALRQNLRDQFVSYRGAWFCEESGCNTRDVTQSKRGSNQGELQVSEVKMQPHVGLVFYPGTPPVGMTATVRDCKGKSKDIPKDKVQPPGRHRISAESDSWVIWLDDKLVADLEVGSGKCSVLTVGIHATWDDDSVYDAQGGVSVKG
ncbi:MAG: hypothetical protein K0V04_16485 [Deltaproteobacteria bacterium]|nr:hypothetical protein [Deltaproteobacteria bacterium]